VNARRALELGLAARVVPDGEVLAVAQAKAAEIAVHPPHAVQHSKQLLLATRADAVRAAREREDEAFKVRIGSPENIEAITAFFEKRTPDFRKKQ
jgi:enoyl-CoA hydratase/carnithine racemase